MKTKIRQFQLQLFIYHLPSSIVSLLNIFLFSYLLLLFMIIITKIKSLSILPIYTIPLLSSYFSQIPDRKKINLLKQLLQTSSRQMKLDYLIKSMHFIHFQSQKFQQSQQNIFTSSQLDNLLTTVSKYIHNMSHKQLTLFLQTISEYDKYKLYSRNEEISKLVARRLNAIHMIDFEGQYILRLLNALQKMKFPSIIISKYVISVVDKLDIKGKFNKLNCIKFFISIMEMKFVHVCHVERFYQSKIEKIKVDDPKEISFLYYAMKIAKASLAEKLRYFEEKSQIRDLVFNPYSQVEDSSTAETSEEQRRQSKKKVREDLQAFLNVLEKNISLTGLQRNICRLYGYQRYPLSTSVAVILTSVEELKPRLIQFFQNNFKTMSYLEFGVLVKLIDQNERSKYYNDYKGRAFKYMSFQEKLELLSIKSDSISPVSKEQLMEEISKIGSISSIEFGLITKVIVKDLNEIDQLQIIRAVEQVLERKDKNV